MRRIAIGVVLVTLSVLSVLAVQRLSAPDELMVTALTKDEASAFERLVVNPYVKAHPDARVKVRFLYQGDDVPGDINSTLPERVSRELRGRTDVFIGLPAETIRVLASADAIEPLDAYAGDSFTTRTIAPAVSAILEAEGGGRLLALAPSFGSMALAYNAELFDRAGVAAPSGVLTWDEAFQLGSQVASRVGGGVAAFSFGPEGYTDFHSAFLQHSPSAGVYVIDGAGVSVETSFSSLWAYFAEAQSQYALRKDGDAFWRGEAALALVYNGQVDDPATFQSHPSYTSFHWDLVPAPVFDRSNPISYANVQSCMVVSSVSPRKPEAAQLIAWACGKDLAVTIASGLDLPWAGSLPSCYDPEILQALRNRADKDYSAFYRNRAPRTRAIQTNEQGYVYVTYLLQRLMIDTVNSRIDAASAARILSSKGPGLYKRTDPVDISDPRVLDELLEY